MFSSVCLLPSIEPCLWMTRRLLRRMNLNKEMTWPWLRDRARDIMDMDMEDMEDTGATVVITAVTTDRATAIMSLATITMDMEFMDKSQPIISPGNGSIDFLYGNIRISNYNNLQSIVFSLVEYWQGLGSHHHSIFFLLKSYHLRLRLVVRRRIFRIFHSWSSRRHRRYLMHYRRCDDWLLEYRRLDDGGWWLGHDPLPVGLVL